MGRMGETWGAMGHKKEDQGSYNGSVAAESFKAKRSWSAEKFHEGEMGVSTDL